MQKLIPSFQGAHSIKEMYVLSMSIFISYTICQLYNMSFLEAYSTKEIYVQSTKESIDIPSIKEVCLFKAHIP